MRRSLSRCGAVTAAALVLGGCSFSYHLGAMFGDEEDRVSHTGTVVIPPPRAADSKDATEQDLALAKLAAAEALARGGKDLSVPWENPRTGARGTVTPLANSYTQDGVVCRDFLASHVRDGAEAWFQGEACRQQRGRWEIRALRPWQKK